MPARKWLITVIKRVLEKIPEGDRAVQVDVGKGHLPTVKTLGVLWLGKEDIFTFIANPPEDDYPLTKRKFLHSRITMLFVI